MNVVAGSPGDVYDAPVWTGQEARLSLMLGAPPLHLALTSTFPPGVVSVHHVVSAKLNVLRRLQDGWLGPGSLAPTQQAFEHYRQFLVALGDTISLDAEAVASGEGTLQVEWECDGVLRLIEFTDRGAWLLESSDKGNVEFRIEPFDAQAALMFFHGNPD